MKWSDTIREAKKAKEAERLRHERSRIDIMKKSKTAFLDAYRKGAATPTPTDWDVVFGGEIEDSATTLSALERKVKEAEEERDNLKHVIAAILDYVSEDEAHARAIYNQATKDI